MTFASSNLLQILEDVLPARFGGAATDYQLVEETDGGVARLVLIVSPRVGAADDVAIRRTFLDALGVHGWAERLMAGTPDRAGTVQVRRQEPVATRAGKILPFHVH